MKKTQSTESIQKAWLYIKYDLLSLHPLCLLHPALLVIAGYAMVNWQMSFEVKVALFALICFASTGLVYHLMMRPLKTRKPENRKSYSNLEENKPATFENHLHDLLLLNKTVL